MNPFFILISFVLATCGQPKSHPETHIKTVAPVETINLMEYGAKGLGVASLKEDTTALRKAIAYLNAKGGGKLYVPNPPKFYAFAGDGVFVGNNIEIYGDGKGKSEIRNVDPLSGSYLHGPLFLFSTYGASDNINIFQPGIEQYPLQDAKMNDKEVILKNPADAAALYKGEIVVLGSGKFNHGTTKAKGRFHNMELNEIANIVNGTIQFTYPLSVNLDSRDGSAPVIVNINNTSSYNKFLHIKNGTSKNIYIHDMSLTQAQINEVSNQPLSADEMGNGLSGVWQEGGAFNSKFQNLYISFYGSMGGNMFTHCEFSNIDLESKRKLIDFGYGSSNNSVHDINWKFLASDASDFAASFIIINDGSHNIDMYNIQAKGDWLGENIILMSETKNINIHDVTFDFPNYSNSSAAILIGDNEGFASHNISLTNVHFTVSRIGFFTTINGDDKLSNLARNISFKNVSFNGTATGDRTSTDAKGGNPRKQAKKAEKTEKNDKPGIGFIARNINGLLINGLSVASGEFLFLNTTNSTLENITAPNSRFVSKNSSIEMNKNNFLDVATDISNPNKRKN